MSKLADPRYQNELNRLFGQASDIHVTTSATFSTFKANFERFRDARLYGSVHRLSKQFEGMDILLIPNASRKNIVAVRTPRGWMIIQPQDPMRNTFDIIRDTVATVQVLSRTTPVVRLGAASALA